MAHDSDGDQEWRRSIGQADVPLRADGRADAPEPWELSISNVGAVTSAMSVRLSDDGERDRAVLEEAPPGPPPKPFDERYVADAKAGVASARASYRRMMRIFWALRLGVIASGLLVAVLSAAGAPVWTVAAFGALAAALEATIAMTNLQNRAVVRGLYADAVARELRTFSLSIEPYAGADAVKVLHGKLEDLRSGASVTQFKLDQAAGNSGVHGNG